MKEHECIVHIGMHKTGSSSIQQSLHHNLKNENFCYVNLISPNHSGKIFSLFAEGRIGYSQKKRNSTQKEIDTINSKTKYLLIKNINTNNKSTKIISGEDIVRFTKYELEAFREFLYIYFDKVTIVSYIRTPMSYMESAFQQQIKGGMKIFNMERCYPNYRKRFEKFDLVFGYENVKLWKYDSKKFPDGNVVMDFSNRLNLNMKKEETMRVNEALSKEALSLLYIYRKYGPGYGIGHSVIRENKSLIDAIKNLGTTKIKFSPSLFESILERNREDILWMEERLGESLSESRQIGSNDIERENDLLTVDKTIIEELRDMLDSHYLPENNNGESLEEIADLIHFLRMKLTGKTQDKTNGDEEMKLIELAQKVKEEKSDKLGKMSENKIALIIREALSQISLEIENSKEETLRIPKLGIFNIKMVEKEVEGNIVTRKRILFRSTELKKK